MNPWSDLPWAEQQAEWDKVQGRLVAEEEILRGHDIGDMIDGLWANAFGTGLGGSEEPEPGKPSPRCRAPSLSQENDNG